MRKRAKSARSGVFIRPTRGAKGVQVRPYEEFLEEWKKESDKWAGGIFTSLPIHAPEIHGDLKEEAVEDIMRVVWFRVGKDMTDEERGKVLRANLDEIKRYTSELVDRTVEERWERVQAAG